jgi:tetratricopeptide (TPR) repeat protein
MVSKRKESKERRRDDDRRGGTPAACGRAGWLSRPWKAAAFVFVVAFLLYANTFGHDFVWDDRDLIAENPAVRSLDGETVQRIFTENFWRSSQLGGGYYRPLVSLSYHIQYQIFDGKPGGFHIVNAIWNAAVCALVLAFVYLLFGNIVFALVTALLFAVHPIHTENVAWIAGRTDVLSTLWAMASLVFYVLARKRRRVWWLVAALAAFAVSLLAKESSAFLPLVIVLLEWGPFGFGKLLAPSKRSVLRPTLYFAILVVYLLQRYAVIGLVGSTYNAYAPGALGALALPLSILAGYVLKLVFPLRLSGEYDAPIPDGWADVHVLAGLLILAAIVWSVVRYRRRPDVVLGAGVFLFGLAPVINIIPLGEVSAERFLYFPSLGFALVLGSLFSSALVAKYPTWRQLAANGYIAIPKMKPSLAGNLTVLLAVVLIALAARTVARNGDWKTEEILFAKTAAASPHSARAQLNIGNVARRNGRTEDAIAAYKRSLEIDPDYPDAMSNLAGIYGAQGRFDDALPLVERALEIAPDDVTLLNNLGSIYFEQRRFAEAAQLFERVLSLDSRNLIAHFNLGLIQYRARDYDSARSHFERVAGAGAQLDLSYYYLALLEQASGNVAAAKRHARTFLSVHKQNDPYRQRAQAILSGP